MKRQCMFLIHTKTLLLSNRVPFSYFSGCGSKKGKQLQDLPLSNRAFTDHSEVLNVSCEHIIRLCKENMEPLFLQTLKTKITETLEK